MLGNAKVPTVQGEVIMKTLRERKLRRVVVLLAFGLALTLPVDAQQNTGSIKGIVRDQSGGVIVGAALTARHEATGIELRVVTNSEGAYAISPLNIGEYTLTAASQGFKTVKIPAIRVVSAETRLVDVELPIGEITDTATVTSEIVTVDTAASTLGTTRVNEELERLPLAIAGDRGYRNPLAFVSTISGVSFDPSSGRMFDMARMNGAPTGQVSYQVDGLNAGTQGHEIADDFSYPPPDGVSEFRLTASNNAEFGWNFGVGISLTLKSGTNQFHGTIFEYLRNSALDARNFFAATKGAQKFNEFGYVLGGPVILPNYNGKNKTFFFTTYDGYKNRASPAGINATVPTAAMRVGNFSELLGPQIGMDSLGRPILQGQIFDPLTTRSDGRGGFARDPFPGNVIPTNRLSQLSLNLQNGYPLPTGSGTQLNWVGESNPVFHDIDRTLLKVDHEFNQAHRISVTWEQMWRSNQVGSGIFSPEISNRIGFTTTMYGYRFNYNWIMRPNLLFGLRTGVRKEPRTTGSQGLPSEDFGSRAGLKGVFTPQAPRVQIQGITGFGPLFQALTDTGQSIPASVDLSWTKGSHTFKFGTEFLHLIKYASGAAGPTAGLFTFSDLGTGLPGFPAPATGAGYASYLLGDVNTSQLESTRGADRFTHGAWALYAQDQWRVTSRLTLNYGLRWDLYLPRTELFDRMSSFDPTVPNPSAGGRLGAVTFWGDGPGRNGRRHLYDYNYRAFGPRFGFAYTLDSRTVVRGHYGVAYNALFGAGLSGFSQPFVGWGGRIDVNSLNNGVTPAYNWNNGFPPVFPSFPNFNPSIINGSGIAYYDPSDVKPARGQNISFGIEHELPGGIALRADYIANLMHGLPTANLVQWNQLDPKYFSLGNLLLANISSPQAQAAGIPIPYPGFNGSVAQALRPYPQFQDLPQHLAPAGDATYHSLQVNLQKRLGRGLSFLIAYTLSKSLGTDNFGNAGQATVVLQHTNLRRTAKQLNVLDRPHTLAISYTYDLPFGPGKRFGQWENPFLKQLVAGWQVSGIHNYMSGAPVLIANAATIPTGITVWANRVPDVPIETGNGCGSYDPNDPSRNRYLNINAFAVPAPFSFGNTSQLPSTRTCGYLNESLSIHKAFPLKENINLRFGSDFFNAFNRHQWTNLSTNITVPGSFGRYGGASPARTVQFYLKLEF
jgi:carboxypeptidase family protein